jgi:hypothetical protein
VSKRSAQRNRHREVLPPPPRIQKQVIAPEDFQACVQLGAQVLDKVHATALWDTAQMTRSGLPAGIIAALAGAGAVARAVGLAVARHAEPPPAGVDLREALPPWAADVLTAVGLCPPAAPPPEEKAGPVEDQDELVRRAAAAGIELAR